MFKFRGWGMQIYVGHVQKGEDKGERLPPHPQSKSTGSKRVSRYDACDQHSEWLPILGFHGALRKKWLYNKAAPPTPTGEDKWASFFSQVVRKGYIRRGNVVSKFMTLN